MNALDTNILLYAYDQRDPVKQQESQRLLATVRPFGLIWQVGCELIAASGKLKGSGFTALACDSATAFHSGTVYWLPRAFALECSNSSRKTWALLGPSILYL